MFWKLSLLLVTITIVTTSQLNDGISINHHRTIRAPDVVRQTRAIKPWGFFTKIGTIWNLINQQYNETTYALGNVRDLLYDGFSDTATTPKYRPTPPPTKTPNETTTTTTEKYRLSRKEVGKILNRNFRGLQKLFKLEWNDAMNQSHYSIQEYKRDFGNALAPYAVPKKFESKN